MQGKEIFGNSIVCTYFYFMKEIIRKEVHLPGPATRILIKEAKRLKISLKRLMEDTIIHKANIIQGKKLLRKLPNPQPEQ